MAARLASSDSADASDSAGGAMDEDDLFVGVMDIDEGMRAQPPRRARVDEDMSEVAEIMLNLKVCMPSLCVLRLPRMQSAGDAIMSAGPCT